MIRQSILLFTLLLLVGNAVAERADRNKPVNLEADRITVDDAKRQHIFEGNVTLSQGTLTIHANRIVVTQDAEGFQRGVAYGAPARFRQKRDTGEGYIEGEGERIEYDARIEKAEFFNQAWVRNGLDEIRGNYISYDAKTERYVVTSATDGKGNVVPSGRVRAVIQPKSKSPDLPSPGETPAAKAP